MRANSGSIECCSSRSAARPAHIRWDGGRADDEHAPFAAASCARAVARRSGGIGGGLSRGDQSGGARCLARFARPLGAGRLRRALCARHARHRSRGDLRPCRRRLVRGDLGQPLELAGRHARRHPCVPGRALHRRRLGCVQGRRAAQTADRRGRRGGLALRRLGPACPLFPFNLSNYALGLTRIPLPHYVIATLVLMVPGVVAYTWLGHAGRRALTGEADAVRYGLFALALLAAIALLPRLVGRMRHSFTWIEPKDLKRRLDGGEAVTVIDVRGPDEFTGPFGHIAAARNIPVAELDSRLAELAGLERAPLVLVCRTDKRSAAAARTLRVAGFTQVSVLRRGMEQWNDAGLPVEGRTAAATA